jgi:hypothetical protein
VKSVRLDRAKGNLPEDLSRQTHATFSTPIRRLRSGPAIYGFTLATLAYPCPHE